MTANTLKDFEDISIQLSQVNDKRLVETICWAELKFVLRNEISPSFWNHFKCKCYPEPEIQAPLVKYQQFECFVSAVTELSSNFDRLKHIVFNVNLFETNDVLLNKKLKEMIRDVLLAQLPAHFSDVVAGFYSVAYEVFCVLYPEKDIEDIDGKNFNNCTGCNFDHNACRCAALQENINDVNRILIDLGLLDRIAGQSITSLIQNRIKHHIIDNCQGVLDRSHLKELVTWVQQRITKWLIHIFNYGNIKIEEADNKTKSVIEGFSVKLTYYLYENFAQSIIDQFFNIIIDFPDSTPAIDDLKVCLEKIDLRKHLMETIKSSLQSRILHPGVNTTDILTGYVAAIKAIRHLDPSGLILESVTEPIKEYLRKRSDTVRRVVSSLTEEGPTDLSEELAKGEVVKDSVSCLNTEINNWETWLPDPFCLESRNQRTPYTLKRTADIISMIVDIYGSKELFMNEYRNLMADRMLSLLDLNPEKEIRNLELLKLRFGENLLHNCEVMIKDVTDSKRINSHISSDPNYLHEKKFDINLLIVSAQFWPTFNKEQLELPLEIQNEFKKYITSYESYKGNRTLNLRTVTGKVSIELEFGNKTSVLTVSPTQAVILYYFQTKNKWTIDELSTVMKVPQCTVRRRIVFWINYGILEEVHYDLYKLVEGHLRPNTLDDCQTCSADIEDETESAMASANDQREEELQVFWSYIVGMLTNLDSLPLERIHQMLKLFASNGVGKEFTQDELKEFLQRKVREHKLIYSCGVYQLTK